MENDAAHFMVSTQVSFTSEKDIYLDSNGWRLCLLQRALDHFLPQLTRVLFNTGFFIDSEGGGDFLLICVESIYRPLLIGVCLL